MDSTKDVIVIGGSLAGLMHALALKSFGRNIRVFEARSYDDLAAEAAGITLWPHAQKLITTYVPEVDLDQIAFQNHTMRIMTGDAVALTDAPITDDIRTTSWSVVYRLLRNACEKHGGDGGVVTFEMERPICTIKEQGETMVVTYKKDDGGEEEARASLVIAADGARSFARSQVLPGLKATYAGYLAWRGNFPEQEAPPELKSVLDGDLAMVKFEGSYILVYATPGEAGTKQPGERLLEWCWYDTCDSSSSEWSEFMTDAKGALHNYTVTADLLRPEAWRLQLARRKDTVSSLWHRLFAISTVSRLPLLTAIRSFDNTSASFFDRKLLLVGEAFSLIRPHMGASCSIPALQALTLVDVLKGEKTWNEVEKEVVSYSTKQATVSEATGVFGMTGKWKF